MAKEHFGEILRIEREKLGLSLDQVTASTRVRRKFLQAFEDSDFLEMPPHGYALNMIVSYARFLGLDPNDILDAFNKDYATYEALNVRSDDQYRSNTGSKSLQKDSSSQRRGSVSSSRNKRTARSRATSYNDQGHERVRRGESSYSSGDANRGVTTHSDNVRFPRTGSAVQGRGSYNAYKEPPKSKKPLYVIIGIVVLLVIALVIWGITSSESKKESLTATTPITGTSQAGNGDATTTGGTSSNGTTTTQSGGIDVTTGAAQPFTVSFELAEGATSYIEVTVDGNKAYSGTAVGPLTETYNATTSVHMTIGTPANVVVKKNGEVVTPTDQSGIGIIDIAASAQQ
jgi:cytoskeletal protein RodZ